MFSVVHRATYGAGVTPAEREAGEARHSASVLADSLRLAHACPKMVSGSGVRAEAAVQGGWQMRLSGRTRAILFDWSRPAHARRVSRFCDAGELPCDSGFTLIEVLVVVAILGVVATVVIMNIASFSARGTVDAANTESHQVHTALIAYMQANNLRTFDGIVGAAGTEDVEHYLLNPQRLQARYTISDGKIVDALPYPDGRWAACTWDAATGQWRIED